jgi:hypothetical protein
MRHPLSRRSVLQAAAGIAAVGSAVVPLRAARAGAGRFTFARMRYRSGDWDADPQMPVNLLDSMVEYTRTQVDPREQVVALDSTEIFAFPFLYMTGHALVRFDAREKEHFGRYVEEGGFVFVDDCNHDLDGLLAKSFEREMTDLFRGRLRALPNGHAVYAAAFHFPEGPPTTQHDNGWGDSQVHGHLKAVSVRGRSISCTEQDYGCEWDYDVSSKQYLAEDNTRFR